MPSLKAEERHAVRFSLNGDRSRARPSRACNSPISCAMCCVPAPMSAASMASVAPARFCSMAPSRSCYARGAGRWLATSSLSKASHRRRRLTVLQQAFRRHHALQCGFCTAGILISLHRISGRKDQPDRARCANSSPGSVPLHRLCADRRGGARCREAAARRREKADMIWCRFSVGGESVVRSSIEGEAVRKAEGVPWGVHKVTAQAFPLSGVKLLCR